MGLVTLLRRRLGTHLLAFVAVLVTVLMSMLVVATLQLLSGAISDAGVRSTLTGVTSSSDRADATVAVHASVKKGSLTEADRIVRERIAALGDGFEVSRVVYPTVRGIEGSDARVRAQLADIEGLTEVVDLVDGRWPTPVATAPDAGPAAGPFEVAVPEATARALELGVGKTLRLPSLTSQTDPVLTVTIVGTYRVRDLDAAIWLDDDLSPAGLRESDYTTYGPFVLGPGVFDSGAVGASQVTWRAATSFDDATPGSITQIRSTFGSGLTALRETVGDQRDAAPRAGGTPSPLFSSGLVDTRLTEHLATATLVSERIRATLLTPVVLLILLGASSLVMATRLLVGLRADETRLMRTRGMSGRQLGAVALADSAIVVLPGVVGALLLAPLLTGAIGRAAGVPLHETTHAEAVRDPGLWIAVGIMALLAVVVIVMTSLRAGLSGSGLGEGARSGSGSRVPAVLQVLSGAGLDLALVGLGVLAVFQLRRYDTAGSTTVDPLTIAAPACIIAGLAVLFLRLLPGAAAQTERVSVGHTGLDRAWGAWQLSRRLASQGGTILLILLCVAMGAMALSHSATAERAIVDQSAFETGAPVRVDSPLGRPLAERAAGDPRHAMPVLRTQTELGSVPSVTQLGVDATRGADIITVRPDLVSGTTWRATMEQLAGARPEVKALGLPTGTKKLTFRMRLATPGATEEDGVIAIRDNFPIRVHVLLQDGQGTVTTVQAGNVRTTSTAATVTLPEGDSALAEPVSLLAFTTALPEWLVDNGAASQALELEVSDLRADSRPVAGVDGLRSDARGVELTLGTEVPLVKELPVVMTRALADSLGAEGKTLTLPISGRNVPVRVVGLVDSVPTARDPHQAMLYDLPTFFATTEAPGSMTSWPQSVPTPREWWLARSDSGAAATTLREAGVPTDVTTLRNDVEQGRRANPVNAGMQAAMLLVTGAALVLAAVGFAATTASLARARHHENAILLALGMPPARIRRVLTIERLSVVVLTVIVGVVMGVVAAYLVVPFLVGGDGHDQVPAVFVVIPWWRLLALAATITALLSAIGIVVLRRTGSDIAAELRMGEAR